MELLFFIGTLLLVSITAVYSSSSSDAIPEQITLSYGQDPSQMVAMWAVWGGQEVKG